LAARAAARRGEATLHVTGITGRAETVERAKAMGAVDEATLDLKTGVAKADLIILALPARLVLETARSLVSRAQPGAIVTDLTSTKTSIVTPVDEAYSRLKSSLRFIGSHPVAGSEKSGIEAAPEVVLTGAYCILTPTQASDSEACRQVDEFWKTLGMKTLRMSPEEHDAVLARSSHLPHLAAFTLIALQNDRSLQVCGSGLRDMTRLAGSDVTLWTDIFTQNASELAKAAGELGRQFLELSREAEALAKTGTPGADAARERLFHFLADARQRHEERFGQAAAALRQAAAGEPTGAAPAE
jgi:prephenate dehydrogenase